MLWRFLLEWKLGALACANSAMVDVYLPITGTVCIVDACRAVMTFSGGPCNCHYDCRLVLFFLQVICKPIKKKYLNTLLLWQNW